ncbi:histidine kinase dimerization/phospho-acceptor domain-containing protein [Eisenbergiella porci]|nr:histidine kinase dimerization/phospho-acceptor domain-containing protein [Eisenbergiella porci]
MERIKHTFKKLTIRKSFALLILLFLLLDIFLCLATAGLLQLLPEKYYALSSPLIVCLSSALCLAAAAYLFYKCKLEEPVRLIKEAAARIGRQDLDFRLSYDSADEMGELCLSVESMRLALEDNYHLLWSQAEEKKRINAAFAHDMRTPLTIIKGYLEFQELSAGSLSHKDLQKQAAVMKKHLARMENYIEAMNSLQTPDGIRAIPSLIRPRKLEEDLFRTAAMLCERLHKSFVPESQLPGSPLSADPEIISRRLFSAVPGFKDTAKSGGLKTVRGLFPRKCRCVLQFCLFSLNRCRGFPHSDIFPKPDKKLKDCLYTDNNRSSQAVRADAGNRRKETAFL